MAIQIAFNFITFLLSFVLFSWIIERRKNVKAPDRQRLPPGPPKLPVIGHLHHIIGSVPHHYPLRNLARTYGPLMHLKFGEVSAIIISSAEAAKMVLKTHDPACADRPKSVATKIMWYNYSDIVFSPYGDYWRQMRKICILELLSAKNVRSFEYIRKDEASLLIESIRSISGAPFDLTERIFLFMNSMTCRASFGNAAMDRAAAIKLIKKALCMAGHFDLADLFPSIKLFNIITWNKFKLLKLRRKLDKILDDVIEEHRKNQDSTKKGYGELGTEDLVDVLLRLKESGEDGISITNDSIKSVIFDMFAAGTESSSTTVDWAMAELMKNPRVMAKAQDEIRQAFSGRKVIQESEIRTPKYLKMVINETLRLHPPVSIIPRACREEFEMEGYHIPLNANVIVNIWSIGRDPNYWHDPESFEPERFEKNPIDFLGSHFEYIPFGSGKRICPGMTFGVANVEFLLGQLLYHFDWKLPPGMGPDDLDMSEVDGIAVSRKSSLRLIAEPYDPMIHEKKHVVFKDPAPGTRIAPEIQCRRRWPNTNTNRKVVCCCPWPGSDTNSKDKAEVVDGLLQSNKYDNNITTSYEKKQRRLPPGPSPLHLIALSHYFIRSLPLHHALTDLAKTYGSLMHFSLGELPLIVVSSPKIAKELLKTNDIACAYRPKTMVSQVISYDYSDVVTSPYGDYWKQLRNICIVELLSAKNIRSFEYIRKDEGSILVDFINSTSPASFNLTERIFWFMNSTTCRAVFGNVSMDRAHTISLIRGAMAAAGHLELADLFPSFKLLLDRFTLKAHDLVKVKPEMDKILDDIIHRHRQNLAVTGKGYGELGTEDFVDVLIRLKEEAQFSMTDNTIKALICDMFAGGTESASSAVDWTMVELVRNPRVMAKVQSEIRQAFGGRKTIEESEIRNLKYLKMVVKESMRLHPPNALIPRSCGEDMEIDGYHIPQNSAIVVNAWLMGRDPSHWREPERFEPERFEGSPIDFLGNNFEFIPFGAGKRICPGMAFAVANVEFVLAQLLYFFDWKLPAGVWAADLDMTEADGFAASRKSSLNLIATPFAFAGVLAS